MSKRTLNLSDTLYDYLLSVSLQETDTQRALRDETNQMKEAMMQISPDQGQFMALLVKLLNAERIIEVGTFTGYSALSMAQALPDKGKLIACDINKEWTTMAQHYWQQAGVAHKIELHLASALDTLKSLIEACQNGQFDFAFIDADKQNYQHYYEHCLQLIRPGGLIAVDNVLWGGSVADDSDQQTDTIAIREFNRFVCQDQRVEMSLVPIGDGLTLARKK
jgi:predicted O-methyltransferase YrrM